MKVNYLSQMGIRVTVSFPFEIGVYHCIFVINIIPRPITSCIEGLISNEIVVYRRVGIKRDHKGHLSTA